MPATPLLRAFVEGDDGGCVFLLPVAFVADGGDVRVIPDPSPYCCCSDTRELVNELRPFGGVNDDDGKSEDIRCRFIAIIVVSVGVFFAANIEVLS